MKLGFRLWKEQPDGTGVVSNVGRSWVGMGGGGAQQLQALGSTSKMKCGGGHLLLQDIREGDVSVTPCREQML